LKNHSIPKFFRETLIQLAVDEKYLIDEDGIQNLKGNTTTTNLRNWEIENYFSDEKMKGEFALKYIQVMEEHFDDKYTPTGAKEIKVFFTKIKGSASLK
jgi:hypothetical protein